MLTKPKSIVVGIDGSESAARALRWAARQARAAHRPLTLVHTVHAVAPAHVDATIADPRPVRGRLDAEGGKVLDAAHREVVGADPELEVHEVCDIADPRELLVQLSSQASMIVVGSRGRGTIRSLLLGSVSVALVRHAHCPVVVIRPGGTGKIRDGVLVGVDATELSLPVLEFAYRQASLHDLPLTVLHTFWDARSAATAAAYPATFDPPESPSERLALAEAMAGLEESYPDVHVTTNVARGRPDEKLLRLGERMDLIVVGAHQNGALSHVLHGSVSVGVVEHASCPVAVVPLGTTP